MHQQNMIKHKFNTHTQNKSQIWSRPATFGLETERAYSGKSR